MAERRDEEFEAKMALVLLVYKEVQQAKQGVDSEKHTVLSFDENPRIRLSQTLLLIWHRLSANTPIGHEIINTRAMRTLSLLAGIDLFDSHILELVRDQHRSKTFIEFLTVSLSLRMTGI
jgi:hypothetical protein